MPIADPTRGWRGLTPDGLPCLRLALYAGCAWREMNAAHGPHTGPGWPRVAAERLVERGIGLEVSVVTVVDLLQLPQDGEGLTRWLRLSGEPDAVISHVGALYQWRRILPTSVRWDELRVRTARSMGRALFPWTRLTDPVVRNLGRPLAPYPGPEPLAGFLAAVAETWPAARVGTIPPIPRLRMSRGTRALQARMARDHAAVTAAAGVAVIDPGAELAALGRRGRAANLSNYNAAGSAVIGGAVADWLLAGAAVPA